MFNFDFMTSLQRNTNFGGRFTVCSGSIFSSSLYVPNKNSRFDKIDSSLDFTVLNLIKGERLSTETNLSICGHRLDQFWDRKKNIKTPYFPYTPLSSADYLVTEMNCLDRLLEGEFVEEVTYREAYEKINDLSLKRMGIDYSVLSNNIEILGIGDELVYRVTPKGNSLVLLYRRGGNPSKKPEPQGEKELSFA